MVYISRATLEALAAEAAASPPKPWPLELRSGKSVSVLSAGTTTLRGSDKRVLVLTYQTANSLSQTAQIAVEVQEVWLAFRRIVEKVQGQAAVIVASEAPTTFGPTKTTRWVWRRDTDGEWHPAKDDDDDQVATK
jgi:hypothetical protein